MNAMMTYLHRLPPGTLFRLHGMPEVCGELIACSNSSATVRINEGGRDVSLDDGQGGVRTFRARRLVTTTWSSDTLVETISQEEFCAMSKKATAKKKTAKSPATTKTKVEAPAGESKATKAAKSKADGKLSAIDAAAKVLADAKEPMNCKELIEAMAAKGLWTSPGGKTPERTLYSALKREINTKGKDARFAKTERGKFAIRG